MKLFHSSKLNQFRSNDLVMQKILDRDSQLEWLTTSQLLESTAKEID